MDSFKRTLSIEILDEVIREQKKIKLDSDPFDCIILEDDDSEKQDDKSDQNIDEIHLNEICSVISDCDPEFIREKLLIHSGSPKSRVQDIINEILDTENYPKLKDIIEKKKKTDSVQSALNREYEIDDICKMHSDPIAHFCDQNRKRSESYKICSKIFLVNSFLNLSQVSVEKILNSTNYSMVLAHNILKDAFKSKEKSLKLRCGLKTSINFQHKKKRFIYLSEANVPLSYPESLDEDFLRELWYIKNEQTVQDEIKKKTKEREHKILKARNENSLFECPCCFDNELLFEDMLSCDKGHLFCKSCIRTYAETNIGEMKYEFPCFHPDGCNSKFSAETLEKVLEKRVNELMNKKICSKEIQRANLENLETCPFCDYAAVIDNTDEKIFSCLNPECMKETCRKCKEPNHLPLSCEELKNTTEVNMRTWIENKMNEAMIRVCYKCNKRFYKEEGCNMMHCECGAKMCYLCRMPIENYDHFRKSKCTQFNDTNKVHLKEMKEAYESALKEFLEKFPDKINLKLKFDPKIFLEQFENDKKKKPLIQRAPNMNQALPILNQEEVLRRANFNNFLDVPPNNMVRNNTQNHLPNIQNNFEYNNFQPNFFPPTFDANNLTHNTFNAYRW